MKWTAAVCKFIYIRKFNQAKQENNEQIDKYVGRLKQLSLSCDFYVQRDDRILQKLICDCQNEKILDKVYNTNANDVNLNQFLAWIREQEYKENDKIIFEKYNFWKYINLKKIFYYIIISFFYLYHHLHHLFYPKLL